MSNQETINNLNKELERAVDSIQILLKTVNIKRDQISDNVDEQLDKLKLILKSLEQENVSLHSLPSKVITFLKEQIPDIASAISKLNHELLNQIIQEYQKELQVLVQVQNQNIQKYNSSIQDIVFQLNKLKKEFGELSARKIQRYFLGISVTVILSVAASLLGSYLLISYFPQKITMEGVSNASIQSSDVTLWSSKNVHISGDVKKRGR